MSTYGQEGIKNARIVSTMLGWEDHGILTFYLQLDYGGSGQAFGGWALDGKPSGRIGDREPSVSCGVAIAGLLKALDLTSWEKLVGQVVRVRSNQSHVAAIGHFLKDQWFEPKEVFDRLIESGR